MRCRGASDVAQIAASRAAGGRWQRHRVRRTDGGTAVLGILLTFLLPFFSRAVALWWHPPRRNVPPSMPLRAWRIIHADFHSGDIRFMCATRRNCLCIASGEERPIGLSRWEQVTRAWRGGTRSWGERGRGGGHRGVEVLRFHKAFGGLTPRLCTALRIFGLLHWLPQYSL